VARGTKAEIRPGVWRLRVYVGDDPTSGNPRQLSRTVRGGARAADGELARFVTEVVRGEVPMGADQTLGDFLDSWLEFIEPHRSPTTIRGYRDKVRRWKSAAGSKRVSKLTAEDLDRTYARWIEDGAAPTTVRHCHRVLAAALRQAQRWGLITRCVTDMARPPAGTHRPAPDFDPSVWRAVMLDLGEREPVTAMAVLLAGVTGARRGELCGLRWSDIDRGRGQWAISRSIRHGLVKTELVVAPTKTGAARRVSLDARTLELLAEYRRQTEEWAVSAGVDVSPDGYILTLDPRGLTPLKPDTVTAGFTRSARRVGVRLRFHDLRHMSASLLIAAGTDVLTVAGRLGHADPSTTLRIYAHAFEARDRQAAEVMGALLPR
jgi:integrase